MDGRTGQYVDDYRLVRHLGSGAFGEVYLGEHVSNQSLVAVKILQLPGENLKDFIKEASTAFRLKHPHIVQLLSFGIGADDTPYLIMSYAPNGTLRDRHPKGSRVPLDLVLSYALPLASALQYAHDRRVVHRDVKPENVLIGQAGEILLSDFGIAVVAPVDRSFSTQNLGGTAPYMSPEQISGKPQPASDQYALATMIYEWLCGERPFQGNQWAILDQQRSSPPPSLREKRPELPAQVEEVVLKALAKQPQDRFASVRDFASALEAAYRATLPGSIPENAPLQPSEPRSAEKPPVSPVLFPGISSRVLSTSGPTLPGPNYQPDLAAVPVIPPPASPPLSGFAPVTTEPVRDGRSMASRETPCRERDISSPFSLTDPPMTAPRQGVSRRAAVLTLAGFVGLGAVGSVLALHTHLQAPPPSTPVPHSPTPITPMTPAVGTTLYTYHSKNSGYGLAWSPDGQSIASASDISTVQIWNAANGHVIYTYQQSGSSAAIRSIAWSPDGKHIAFSDSVSGIVDVWDATTGKHFFTYQGTGGLTSIAWSPDSTLIASGGSAVDVWSVSTGERISTYPGIAGAGNLTGLAWSPDGKRIVSSYLGNVALVWDATTGEHVLVFSSHTQGILNVAWSPDGQFIASGHGDATAVVWEAATGRRLYTYAGHSRTVEGVSWSPDGKRIASASDDGTVQLWDATTGSHVYTYKGHSSFVSRALWSPDGKRVASVGGDNTVQVWIAR